MIQRNGPSVVRGVFVGCILTSTCRCKFNRGFAWNFLVVASVVEFLNSQLLLPSSQELAATAEDVLTGRTTTSNIFRDFPGKTTEAL